MDDGQVACFLLACWFDAYTSTLVSLVVRAAGMTRIVCSDA
jgi:hypothetical protein